MITTAKTVLISILASIALYLLLQLAFFFPFYMTVVVETFNLANVAANDNYVKQSYYEDSLESLIDRPVFNKAWGWSSGDGWNTGNIRITVVNADGGRAVGYDNEFDYDWDGLSFGGETKPYRQRGETVTARVYAVYPLEITIWGKTVTYKVPVSFSITTVGLKYYKDLDYDYLYD